MNGMPGDVVFPHWAARTACCASRGGRRGSPLPAGFSPAGHVMLCGRPGAAVPGAGAFSALQQWPAGSVPYWTCAAHAGVPIGHWGQWHFPGFPWYKAGSIFHLWCDQAGLPPGAGAVPLGNGEGRESRRALRAPGSCSFAQDWGQLGSSYEEWQCWEGTVQSCPAVQHKGKSSRKCEQHCLCPRTPKQPERPWNSHPTAVPGTPCHCLPRALRSATFNCVERACRQEPWPQVQRIPGSLELYLFSLQRCHLFDALLLLPSCSVPKSTTFRSTFLAALCSV